MKKEREIKYGIVKGFWLKEWKWSCRFKFKFEVVEREREREKGQRAKRPDGIWGLRVPTME